MTDFLPLDKTLPYIIYRVVDVLGNTIWHCAVDSTNQPSMVKTRNKYAEYTLIILDTLLSKNEAYNMVARANAQLPQEYIDKFRKQPAKYKTMGASTQPPKVRRAKVIFLSTPDEHSSK